MPDVPIEKRFAILCEIARAQHFAWRDAVADAHPGEPPEETVLRMWRNSGRETGRAYAKHMKRELPLAPQFAASIAWSSVCMGEDARVEPGKDETEAFVRHASCPWLEWHGRRKLLAEDRAGCDAWFRATIEEVNRLTGASLQVETLEALTDGGSSCLRRVWSAK